MLIWKIYMQKYFTRLRIYKFFIILIMIFTSVKKVKHENKLLRLPFGDDSNSYRISLFIGLCLIIFITYSRIIVLELKRKGKKKEKRGITSDSFFIKFLGAVPSNKLDFLSITHTLHARIVRIFSEAPFWW